MSSVLIDVESLSYLPGAELPARERAWRLGRAARSVGRDGGEVGALLELRAAGQGSPPGPTNRKHPHTPSLPEPPHRVHAQPDQAAQSSASGPSRPDTRKPNPRRHPDRRAPPTLRRPSTPPRDTPLPDHARESAEIPQQPKASLPTTNWASAIHTPFGTLRAAGAAAPETPPALAGVSFVSKHLDQSRCEPTLAPGQPAHLWPTVRGERAARRDRFDRRPPSYRTIALATKRTR
jgi:hypothetical protein